MASSLKNFPLATITDGIISYIQYIFGNSEMSPDEYRWNTEDRQSRISISGSFIVDNERPMSQPYVVVERTAFSFGNLAIDNLKSATANTFDPEEGVDIMNGGVSITVGSRSASEASSLANFICLCMLADRKGIMSTLPNLRNLNAGSVSQEQPIVKSSEVTRWEVSINFSASIQIGWYRQEIAPDEFKSVAIKAIMKPKEMYSPTGIVSVASDVIVDPNITFGFETDKDMQFLSKEFDDGWYYLRFEDDEGNRDDSRLFVITEVVDEHSIRIAKFDENEQQTPWESEIGEANINYTIYWNGVHLHVASPNEGN